MVVRIKPSARVTSVRHVTPMLDDDVGRKGSFLSHCSHEFFTETEETFTDGSNGRNCPITTTTTAITASMDAHKFEYVSESE